jgi:hypothetical protein
MNPDLMKALACQRAADMRAAAVDRQQTAAQASGPVTSIRQRAGWVLVQIGLWLAVGEVRA